ncbi:MAG: sugar transferase [Candidatus Dormibacteria bacterium]
MYRRFGKRVLDVVCCALAAVVFSPLWLVIAILIRTTSRGPVFFTRTVVGQGGAPFTYYKFRTMREDPVAEAAHRRWLEEFVKEGKPYRVETLPDGSTRPVFKMVDDPRITGVGRFLRRLGLDEAAQLVNVLRGEMSLVGPRPPIVHEWEQYTPEQRRRLSVKPGITGLYQVEARSQVPFEGMLRYDLEYAERLSLWLDLSIMVRTVWVMASGRGAG